jgi:Zinc-binding dehydrogenase
VASAGNDRALHFTSEGLERLPDCFTPAVLSADGKDGHRQRLLAALLVLGHHRVPFAIEREGAVQRLGVGEQADVVADRLVRELVLPSLDVEFVAEVDVLTSCSLTSSSRLTANGRTDARESQRLAGLLGDGMLRVPVYATYELSQAPDALDALSTTHTQGKLAIRVD